MYKYAKRTLVYGVGLNDANYPVRKMIDGVNWICPFYSAWSDMLKRCYSEKYKGKRPTYAGCYVCIEWLTFSNFKAWMEAQDWKGKQLDKDFILSGNKLYSKDVCTFITGMTNAFITDRSSARGSWKLGVSKRKPSNSFYAQCSNPFTGENEYLGTFSEESDAHQAWKMRKHQHACRLADLQTDDRVANALRTRYL